MWNGKELIVLAKLRNVLLVNLRGRGRGINIRAGLGSNGNFLISIPLLLFKSTNQSTSENDNDRDFQNFDFWRRETSLWKQNYKEGTKWATF